MCKTLPFEWRRARTDSVPVGACICADDGALPGMQTEPRTSGERSVRSQNGCSRGCGRAESDRSEPSPRLEPSQQKIGCQCDDSEYERVSVVGQRNDAKLRNWKPARRRAL